MIIYHLDSEGGFTAADMSRGVSGYAYPTSTNADAAKKNPANVAESMLFAHVPPTRPWEIFHHARCMARLVAAGVIVAMESV